MPGDFNDDGVVNNKDVVAVRDEFKGKGAAKPTIFGDVLGEGTVDASDVKAERKVVGTRLPNSSTTGHKGHRTGRARARALARQHDGSGLPLGRPGVTPRRASGSR